MLTPRYPLAERRAEAAKTGAVRAKMPVIDG